MTPIDISILSKRLPGDEDRLICYRIKKAALMRYVESLWGWDEQLQIAFHQKDWETQKPEIITLGSCDIGTIEIIKNDQELHLGEFYLLPDYQNQGIGSHLLTLLTQEADTLALPIKLEVIKINPAKNLYLRHGFVDIGETETHFLMKREPK
ncbi:GNAT family N-acetyltransferase [Luteolibacter pohnpeiensis]|uniref:GNAT family N-acetyltransferase n=1 Tax=Luteolibacter pohnpeiensis TaxID=454153 RepID=A0A934S2Q2_9BACT|nr:GNAT family N-acetyltransferase [Luteolibacter pohnpeiensis]MBK1882085.1 GNAT family N-acetyltransferase [Luteolibacter pohnpeiensis]